eukprot:m.227236 g.227236  ORF g.227236 m.227236 type:complete len:583 (+) comp15175_c1_seq9:304-2052(+)
MRCSTLNARHVALAGTALLGVCLALLAVCTGGVPVCPELSQGAHSHNALFCICQESTSCFGAACKTGHMHGNAIEGFLATCETCACRFDTTAPKHQATAHIEVVPPEHHPVDNGQTNQTGSTLTRVNDAVIARTNADKLVPAATTVRNLNIIYIKSFKVASTTMSAILQRLAEEQQLKVANRYNAVGVRSSAEFNIIYGHNFNTDKEQFGITAGCVVKQKGDGTWSACGGYQLWMDDYVKHAQHLILVAEPMERIASMYYYELAYTKLRDRLPGDTGYSRMNDDPRFEDPTGQDKKHIARWLQNDFTHKWERVQWWWLREGTQDRSLQQTIELLQEKFLVGLTHRLDESLLMLKRELHLETREILYSSMKAQLSHPKISDWAEEERAFALNLVKETGDLEFYKAAQAKFEQQVQQYGPEQLMADKNKFQELLKKLQAECAATYIESEVLHIPDQVYCMLEHYDGHYDRQVRTTEHLGCYRDLGTTSGFSSRFSLKMVSKTLTLSTCWRRCQREGYKYTALFFGTNCYCGNEAPKEEHVELTAELCTSPCPGDSERMCGGLKGYSVYKELPRAMDHPDPIITI